MMKRLRRLFRRKPKPKPSPLSAYRLVVWVQAGRADERRMLLNMTLKQLADMSAYHQSLMSVEKLKIEVVKDE